MFLGRTQWATNPRKTCVIHIYDAGDMRLAAELKVYGDFSKLPTMLESYWFPPTVSRDAAGTLQAEFTEASHARETLAGLVRLGVLLQAAGLKPRHIFGCALRLASVDLESFAAVTRAAEARSPRQ